MECFKMLPAHTEGSIYGSYNPNTKYIILLWKWVSDSRTRSDAKVVVSVRDVQIRVDRTSELKPSAIHLHQCFTSGAGGGVGQPGGRSGAGATAWSLQGVNCVPWSGADKQIGVLWVRPLPGNRSWRGISRAVQAINAKIHPMLTRSRRPTDQHLLHAWLIPPAHLRHRRIHQLICADCWSRTRISNQVQDHIYPTLYQPYSNLPETLI